MTKEGETVSEQEWPEFDEANIALHIINNERVWCALIPREQYSRARLCVMTCAGELDVTLKTGLTYKTLRECLVREENRNAALEQQLAEGSRVERYCCCGECNPYPADAIEKQLEISEQQLAASEQQRGELVEALKAILDFTSNDDADFVEYTCCIAEGALAKSQGVQS